MNHSPPPRGHGFTLVELSIVLAILAFLAAAIINGREMIRTAQMNKIARDVEKYKVAVNTFKLKYGQLPGDMSNASNYWGTNCDAGGTTSCNGDGDGFVMKISITKPEYALFWRHLYLSQLIDFPATGTAVAPRNSGNTGDNIPPTSFGAGIYPGGQNSGWMNGKNTLTVALYPSSNPSWVELSKEPNAVWPWTNREALSFDRKFDDGNGATGKIQGTNTYVGNWCRSTVTSDYLNPGPTNGGCQITYVDPF